MMMVMMIREFNTNKKESLGAQHMRITVWHVVTHLTHLRNGGDAFMACSVCCDY